MTSLPGSIAAEKVIPVARGLDGSNAPALARALGEGGLTTIEVTVEGTGGLEALESLRDSDMTVGAGSVRGLEQARAAVAAGAEFLVSAHLDTAIAGWARENDVPYLPGALSPTEIAAAWSLGPPAVKVFPAQLGGPAYVRSLLGPFPDLALIPTGGVDGGNAGAYLEAGAVAIGVGGWLTSHSDLSLVAARATEIVSRVV